MTIANSILLADNAFGTIASGLTVSDTTLTFTTGHGARFPVVAAGQVLYLTLLNSTNVLEIVKVTAHASGADTATMVRAANGTAAKTWSAGDRVEARWTSEVLRRLQDEAMRKTVLSTADSGATYTGSMDFVHYGYVTGLIYHLTAATTNSGAGPTISLDSLGAVTVVLDGGGALAASQMPVNGLYAYDGTNFILLNQALTSAASQAEMEAGTETALRTVSPLRVAQSRLVLGTAVASTSGTSIDFTGIPAGVKRVTINFVGVSTNGTSALLAQIGDSGGIEATGYLGSSALIAGAYAGAVGVLTFTAGLGVANRVSGAAAADLYHGSVVFELENSSAFTWVGRSMISDSNASSGQLFLASCSKSLSAALDRVRITTVNGTDTFDAGEINISYS